MQTHSLAQRSAESRMNHRLAAYTDGNIRLRITLSTGEEIVGFLGQCGTDYLSICKDEARMVLECIVGITQVATIRIVNED